MTREQEKKMTKLIQPLVEQIVKKQKLNESKGDIKALKEMQNIIVQATKRISAVTTDYDYETQNEVFNILGNASDAIEKSLKYHTKNSIEKES